MHAIGLYRVENTSYMSLAFWLHAPNFPYKFVNQIHARVKCLLACFQCTVYLASTIMLPCYYDVHAWRVQTGIRVSLPVRLCTDLNLTLWKVVWFLLLLRMSHYMNQLLLCRFQCQWHYNQVTVRGLSTNRFASCITGAMNCIVVLHCGVARRWFRTRSMRYVIVRLNVISPTCNQIDSRIVFWWSPIHKFNCHCSTKGKLYY